MSNITPEQFAATLLQRLGIPQTPGAIQGLVGWERAEGGNWNNSARYNPLNTTMPAPGAGNTGTQGNIKVYRDWNQGLDATARTLRNGLYGPILSALKTGDPNQIASAIGASKWGTNANLVRQTILNGHAKMAQPVPGLDGGGGSQPTSGSQSAQPGFQDPGQAGDYTSLLSSLLSQSKPQQPMAGSVAVAPPAFAATPPLPQGARAAQIQPQVQQGADDTLRSALSLLAASGGSGGGTTPSASPSGSGGTGDTSDAASTGSSKVTGKFRPGDPVLGGTGVGGVHPTEGLAGYPARDYFAPAGSAVVAPVSGKVVKLSGHDPSLGPVQGPHGPLGWSVYIQGDDGRTYFLTHMGSRDVKAGETVRAGQNIGTVADYAKYGTPSHIHLGVHG